MTLSRLTTCERSRRQSKAQGEQEMSTSSMPGHPGDEGGLPGQESNYGLAKGEQPPQAVPARPEGRDEDAPDGPPRRRRRGKRRNKSGAGEGPWAAAVAVAAVTCLVTLIGMFATH